MTDKKRNGELREGAIARKEQEALESVNGFAEAAKSALASAEKAQKKASPAASDAHGLSGADHVRLVMGLGVKPLDLLDEDDGRGTQPRNNSALR